MNLLLPLVALVAAPRRLVFSANGTIAEPEKPQDPMLLRGFTWLYTLRSDDQANVTDEDRQVSTLLPATNFARLVMVHWHDTDGAKKGGDCAGDDASLGYLTPACLDMFDRTIAWAAPSMWVTISARSALAAGDGKSGETVWTNTTLRQQMISMWSFLALRYANHDNIAGFEVMSEPRTEDATAVHAFHVDACAAVWAADTGAGCFIGPGAYYDRTHLSAQYLLADPRVVYAANMFDYVQGTNASDVRDQLTRKLGMISNFSTTFGVPVWIDQWGLLGAAPGGDAAQASYMREILLLFAEARFHWSYWIWRRPMAWPCPGGYAVNGQYQNGTWSLSSLKLDTLGHWIGQSPASLPPYNPIVPTPLAPESLAECEAHAKVMCATSVPQGYTACHQCVFKHRNDLLEEGCDFDTYHTDIIKAVCGPPPTFSRAY